MTTANERAINAAVDWAVKIASDNTFHYGESKWAHHSGCYFCGTNGKNSAKVQDGAKYEDQLKTYCCNPFVTAAYHHGAGAPSIDCKVKDKRINLANDTNKALQNTKEWKKISKPANITSLKKGDILQTPTHVMLYIGDGKIVHAAGHDDGKKNSTSWNNSIRVQTCPAAKWNATTKIYRYIGNGKFGGVNMFEIGKVYTLQDDMNIRSGAGSENALVPFEQWTTGAQAQATESGMLAKGTRVTCKNVEELSNGAIWIQIPSGWICAIGSTGKVFVAEEAPVEPKPEPPVVEETPTPEVPPTDEPIIDETPNEPPVEEPPVIEDEPVVDVPPTEDEEDVPPIDETPETPVVEDDTISNIASIIAFVVSTSALAYKNNATGKFNMICKNIQAYIKKHGFDQTYDVVMSALAKNNDEVQ